VFVYTILYIVSSLFTNDCVLFVRLLIVFNLIYARISLGFILVWKIAKSLISKNYGIEIVGNNWSGLQSLSIKRRKKIKRMESIPWFVKEQRQ